MQVHAESIEKAIAGLTVLRDRKVLTSVKSLEDEIDSYEAAKTVLKEAHLICADLLIALSEIASECSGRTITETDRRNFRDAHLIDDALYSSDLWAEEIAESIAETSSPYSTLNVVQLGLTSPVARV